MKIKPFNQNTFSLTIYCILGIILILAIVFLSIFINNIYNIYLKKTIFPMINEGFENGLSKQVVSSTKMTTPDTLKNILQKSRPSGEDIAALQGAYEQFKNLNADFCKDWSKFIEIGRDYEKQNSNETGNGGSAVGTGTIKEYIRLISLREKKTFVDCTVQYPEKIDIGMNMQQMPYDSKAYIDSLNYGIKQLDKIQKDTQKALQGITDSNSIGAKSSPVDLNKNEKKEGFLDITSQNCEEKDGIIRCVLSIDTTNRNLEGRAANRLIEILEKEDSIRKKIIEFQNEMKKVQYLKERAESGEIVKDVKVTI